MLLVLLLTREAEGATPGLTFPLGKGEEALVELVLTPVVGPDPLTLFATEGGRVDVEVIDPDVPLNPELVEAADDGTLGPVSPGPAPPVG